MVKIIKCKVCGEMKPHEAKNMCRLCYVRAKAAKKNMCERNKWRHETGKTEPLCVNKSCSSYLGVYIANKIMKDLYPESEKMPYGNPGYDHVLKNGDKIRVCTSTFHKTKRRNFWGFHTKQKTTADYFIFMAFKDRNSDDPLHIWKIPNFGTIQDQQLVSIAESTLSKWSSFEITIG